LPFDIPDTRPSSLSVLLHFCSSSSDGRRRSFSPTGPANFPTITEGEIKIDDPRAPDVRQLLATHLAFAHAPTPPEDRHALDVDGLSEPAVTFFSFRRDGVLLGVGALQHLDEDHAEVKSMHTVQAARGQGVGRRMIEHLIGVARAAGYKRLSLETGSMAEFAPARALYASVGFKLCEPFGAYRASPNSTYMTLRL
jgi:putative acetyltransferase